MYIICTCSSTCFEGVSDLNCMLCLCRHTSGYCLSIVSVGSPQCIHLVCSLCLIGTSLMMWSRSDLTLLSTREETPLTCKHSFNCLVTGVYVLGLGSSGFM